MLCSNKILRIKGNIKEVMISPVSTIISRLPGNRVLVAKTGAHEPHEDLTESQKTAVDRLGKKDQEVREHETGHMRSPELLKMGGPRYRYVEGPDGKMYAVGGEVTVSTKGTENPKEALAQAEALKKAALSSNNPSPADFAASSSASQMAVEALTRMKDDNPYGKHRDDETLLKNRFDFKA